MFTGIIQEIGTIKKITKSSREYVIEISCKTILEDAKIGDSIAVNGICLTISSFGKGSFSVDVMPETLYRTSLRGIVIGSQVNLEPALTLSTRLGGHLVSGHIDGTGTIRMIRNEANARWFTIEAGQDILKYVVVKGSVTLDGTSLTVVFVDESSFTISLIPHTRSITTLGDRKTGDVLNIECDIIGKYIEKLLKQTMQDPSEREYGAKEKLSLEFLSKYGFL